MSAGVLVSKLGYYVPFMIGSTVLTAIGTGLLTTLDHNSNVAGQILFQIVAGAGIGMYVVVFYTKFSDSRGDKRRGNLFQEGVKIHVSPPPPSPFYRNATLNWRMGEGECNSHS